MLHRYVGVWAITVGVSLAFVNVAGASVGAHVRISHGEPLNDLHVSPGAVFSVGESRICQSGYATSVRDVPESEKRRVYAEYGIAPHTPGQYEIDHVIPLELGGDNSITNLWPELNDHPHGYLNSKDILENRLHALVCAGRVALIGAQRAIATNWVNEFHTVLGYWPSTGGARTTTSASTAPPGSGTVQLTRTPVTLAPGEVESIGAHSSRVRDTCSLTVTLPSGRVSTAKGLGPRSTDAGGDVVWRWRVASATGSGVATYVISCRAGVASGRFTIR